MKKQLLIFLVVGMCLLQKGVSQNNIRIGATTGATLSKYRGNDIIEKSDAGIGFSVGMSFAYAFNENWALQTNVNYARKQFSQTVKAFVLFDFEEETIDIKTHYDYLELPVLVKYNLGSSKRFFVNGGPFLAYLLAAKSKTENFPSTDISETHNKLDLGLSLGVGATFHLNSKQDLSIELRDNLGLLNISKTEVYNDGTIKTNSLNLIVTWSIAM